jgi:Gas vesicle protein G
MGLITGLLTLPLAPVRGVAWVAEVVAEEADRELEQANAPERRLADLEAARATGEISEEDAERLETEIIEDMIARRTESDPVVEP